MPARAYAQNNVVVLEAGRSKIELSPYVKYFHDRESQMDKTQMFDMAKANKFKALPNGNATFYINGGGYDGNNYTPPPDPNYDEGANNGPGQCTLTNLWHTEPGPTVHVFFANFQVFYATTDILCRLVNCKNGNVNMKAHITGGDGGVINQGSTSMYTVSKVNHKDQKYWEVKTKNYIVIDFSATVGGIVNVQTGNGYNETTFYLNYN